MVACCWVVRTTLLNRSSVFSPFSRADVNHTRDEAERSPRVVAKQSRAHVRKHEMSIPVPVALFQSVGRALAGKDGSNTFPDSRRYHRGG